MIRRKKVAFIAGLMGFKSRFLVVFMAIKDVLFRRSRYESDQKGGFRKHAPSFTPRT